MNVLSRIVCCMIFIFPVSLCFSGTLYVDGNAPNDPGPGSAAISDTLEDGTTDHPFDAIQEAITAADPNDTILVADGTYTGPGNRDIDFLGKPITVQSENGPETCIIDCQGTEENPHRAFIFQSGETHDSILSGFSIINGYGKEKTFFIPEQGTYIAGRFGGGIYSDNTSPVISNCIFENSIGPEGGGGIYCYSGSPIITDSIFRKNLGSGAAISSNNSSITISGCHFTANDSTQYTGIFFSDDTIITSDGVGAILLCQGSTDISNCIVSGNTGFYNGGLTLIDTETHIKNCLFVDNRGFEHASFTGTFWGPFEEIETNKMISAKYCIFNNNIDSEGLEILDGTELCIGPGAQPYFYPIYEINYSCVQALDPNLPGIGNINANPLFVNPGYWDDKGTPDIWDDVWMDGDYHLKSAGWRWDTSAQQWTWDDETSPCIDAGNPGMALGDEPTKLDVDPLNRWGENIRINMGAYGGTAEASMVPPGWALLCDIDNSGSVDLSDLVPMAAAWLQSGQNQPPDVSRNGTVTIEDFALLAQDWLNTTIWY